MRITKAHLDYWTQRRALPAWAIGLTVPVGVDSLINAQTDETREKHFEAHNLLVVLCMIRMRGANLREGLRQIVAASGTAINPKRRMGYAKRWLARMPEPSFSSETDGSARECGAGGSISGLNLVRMAHETLEPRRSGAHSPSEEGLKRGAEAPDRSP